MSTGGVGERAVWARRFVSSLWRQRARLVQAIEADGWPRAMAEAGLEHHHHTWNIDGLLEALELELTGLGGLEALERPVSVPQLPGGRRLVVPQEVVHVWPALPGAGLTPLLMGWLLGCPRQVIRPSSRGRTLAMELFRSWQQLPEAPGPVRDALTLTGQEASWSTADVVVLSGSDETVAQIHRFLGSPHPRQRPQLVAYGHRVSLALIDGRDGPPPPPIAAALAHDTVLWHQTGCFSPRAVIYCGPSQAEAEAFGRLLGDQIAVAERALQATRPNDALLAERAQALGLAELLGVPRYAGEGGLGWVQPERGPFRGERIAPHVLSLHHITGAGALAEAIAVDPSQLQGAALYCPDGGPRRAAWIEALAQRGVTRVCRPGHLQRPPPDWLHDGAVNALGWLRITTVDA